MRSNLNVCLLMAAVLLAGCRDEGPPPKTGVQLEIEVEHDPEVDLSTFTSFEVIQPTTLVEDPAPPNFAELETEIIAAISDELIAKGLRVDNQSPELLVNPLVTIAERDDGLDFYDVQFGSYWGYAYPWAQSEEAPRGTLVIDVIDQRARNTPADDRLIYRGSALGLLAEDPDVVRTELRNAVQAMLVSWPERPSR